MPFEVYDKMTGKNAVFERKPSEQDLMEAFGQFEAKQSVSIPKTPQEQWQEEFKQRFMPRMMSSIIKETGKLGAEGGGMIAGATALGSIHPLLAPVGAGLGYAAVKGAERGLGLNKPSPIVTEELKKQAGEFKTGMEGYLIGETALPMVSKAISPIKKGISFLKGKIAHTASPSVKAGDYLIANTSEGAIYAKNMEEAKKIQEEIPDLIFTRGQKTFGPKELKSERALALTPKGGQVNQEIIVNNNNAIRKYYQKHFPEKEGIQDVLKSASDLKAVIETGKKKVVGVVEAEAQKLGARPDIQTSGETILGRAQELERGAITKSQTLYQKIGDMTIPAKKIAEDIDEIIKPQGKYEEIAETVPKLLHKVKKDLVPPYDEWSMKVYGKSWNEIPKKSQDALKQSIPELTKTPEMSLGDLRGLRSEVLEQIRGLEKGTPTPNTNRLTSRLVKFLKSIDDTLDEVGKTGEGENVKKLREANKVFKEERIIPFEQKTVGKVLQTGQRGEVSRIDNSQIAGQFFRNPDTADDFIRAMGKDPQAKQAIEDYASQDLLQRATNPDTGDIESKRVLRWLFKNNKVLEKFGLKDKFKDVKNATSILEQAKLLETEFNKSAASKLLGADAEQAIANAFTGHGKSTGQVADELLKLTKGDEAATRGVKKAFGDYLLKKVQLTSTDIATNPSMSVDKLKKVFAQYAPAMRVLYKDEPEKIKALMTIQKAYDILNRTSYSLLKGSDTTEKTLDTLGRMFGIAVTKRLSALNLIESLVRQYKRNLTEVMDDYLIKATYDPEAAQTLINLAKGIKPEEVVKKFDAHLRTFVGIKLQEPVTQGIKSGIESLIESFLPQQPEQQETTSQQPAMVMTKQATPTGKIVDAEMPAEEALSSIKEDLNTIPKIQEDVENLKSLSEILATNQYNIPKQYQNELKAFSKNLQKKKKLSVYEADKQAVEHLKKIYEQEKINIESQTGEQ